MPGRPTNLDNVRARAYCACSRCGRGLFGRFFSCQSFPSSFSFSLGDGPMKTEILSQRAVEPKNNQPTKINRSRCSSRLYIRSFDFLLYINDIVENINLQLDVLRMIILCILLLTIPVEAAYQLNSDLFKIHQWLVTFNPLKSESVIFSRKRNRSNHPQVLTVQQPIQEVNLHKHYSIIFSSDCTWHDRLEYI